MRFWRDQSNYFIDLIHLALGVTFFDLTTSAESFHRSMKMSVSCWCQRRYLRFKQINRIDWLRKELDKPKMRMKREFVFSVTDALSKRIQFTFS